VPHVPLSYLIGTVGLLAVLIAAVFIRSNTILQIETQADSAGLKDIAENVSTQLGSILSLSEANGGKTVESVYFHITIPTAENGRGYTISTRQTATGWKVVANLSDTPSISGVAGINVGPTPSCATPPCVYLYNACPTSYPAKIIPRTIILSGDPKTAVWAAPCTDGPKSGAQIGIGDTGP
jgi:hypothetical protein